MRTPTFALDLGVTAGRYSAVARGLSDLTSGHPSRVTPRPVPVGPRPGWPTGPEPGEDRDSEELRLLIPYNGTAVARSALDTVTGLGPTGRVTAWVLYVRHWDASATGQRLCLESSDEAQRCVRSAVAELRRRGVPASGVVRDAPREKVGHAIAAEAERRCVSCIVMGTHAHGPVVAALLGSVTRRVARTTARPLVLVKPERDPSPRHAFHRSPVHPPPGIA